MAKQVLEIEVPDGKKLFGKLLFEVSCSGKNCDWEWME